ncbi:hypothetical protein HG531_000597 [Fusarium graminearum]|nr:hypothetical protein HG531_000597 [Fusarium graminearum]
MRCWGVGRVSSGEPTLSVGESNGQGNSLRLTLADIGSGVPHPAAVRANVGGKLHLGDNVVVGADLEGLVASHDQSGLAVLLVLEQTDVTSTTLLPLAALLDELEKLGAHLESLLLSLLVGLGINLLGQLDDRLEVNVLGLGGILLYKQRRLSGLSLSLSATGVITALLVVLLLLLGTAAEHGEHGGGCNRLLSLSGLGLLRLGLLRLGLLRLGLLNLGLLDLGLGGLGSRHFDG